MKYHTFYRLVTFWVAKIWDLFMANLWHFRSLIPIISLGILMFACHVKVTSDPTTVKLDDDHICVIHKVALFNPELVTEKAWYIN